VRCGVLPPVNKYRCNHCGLSFPEGWGGYFYVEVDEDFLDKRIADLQARVEFYSKVLRDIDRYVFELTERILRELGEFKDKVQEVIRQVWMAESCERREGMIERVINRLFSIRSIEELREALTRMETQNREFIRDTPLIRLLVDLRRYIESRMSEAESLAKELNDIKEQLRASGKRSTRIRCPHPGETEHAERILGVSSAHPLFKQRTGFNSYAICLDCLHQFEADFRDEKVNEWRLWYGRPSFKEAFRGRPQMKDERRCPRCGSTNVKTVFELIGEKCPICKVGVIEEIETGIVA
jgi:rubredoxin